MLDFQNISVYQKENKILDNFSLSVPDGAILALLGSDRRAKHVLLKMAAGSRLPDAGQVLLDEIPVRQDDKMLCQNIGYMPVEYGFYHLLKLSEYYELFLSLCQVGARYRQRRIDEVLELFDLKKYENMFIGEIPSEYYPLLYLGKTVLTRPKWLLLDEPFRNMDGGSRREMMRVLIAVHEEGTSVVLNTLMYPDMMDFVTDVAVVETGRNTLFGPIEEVYEDALREKPVRMHVLAEMESALAVLKENPLVTRVTVDGENVIFRFNGGEREEAELLTELVGSGALIKNYMRDQANLDDIFRR